MVNFSLVYNTHTTTTSALLQFIIFNDGGISGIATNGGSANGQNVIELGC